MTIENFKELLLELGEELDTPLHPDERNICRLEINEAIFVQLELDRSEQNLIIACQVTELPPGTFKDQVLKALLRGNDAINKRIGTFSFLAKTNLVILHYKCHLSQMDGPALVEILIEFSNQAIHWRTAIEQGKTHPEGSLMETSTGGEGMQAGLKT